MNNFIKKALISEKSYLSATTGKFTFIVDRHADTNKVAKLVEDLFKVTVLSLNSMNYKGKLKVSRKNRGKRADFKKVILTLKPGDKIDLFEMETAEKKEKAKKEKVTEEKKQD